MGGRRPGDITSHARLTHDSAGANFMPLEVKTRNFVRLALYVLMPSRETVTCKAEKGWRQQRCGWEQSRHTARGLWCAKMRVLHKKT